MTGNDIREVTHHPSIEDGNLTVYFESEATRKAFFEMPVNHSNRYQPLPATMDDDRGG